MNMRNEYTDEFENLKYLSDDDLYNVLQNTRIELYCEEQQRRKQYLEQRLDCICLLLEQRGLDAHKQF